jgi:hypothetical protein
MGIKRTEVVVAIGIFGLLSVALISGCDTRTRSADPLANRTKAADMQKKVRPGMSFEEAKAALGPDAYGQQALDKGTLAYEGPDGTLRVDFASYRVDHISFQPRNQPRTVQDIRAKVKVGMAQAEVFQAVGEPNGTEQSSQNGVVTSLRQRYTGSDGSVILEYSGGVVSSIK